jgi:hypothetical protein
VIQYLRLGLYAVVAAVLFGAGYRTCHVVNVVPLELAAQKAQTAAEAEKAQFLEDAAKKQKELQDAVDQANQVASDAAKARAVAASNAASADKRLRDYIASAIKPVGPGLPATPESIASNPAAQAGWVLAGQLDTYATECAAESDRLGDEVRRLEASR